MYTFEIKNPKGHISEFKNITKVVIPALGDDTVLEGDAIFTYQYPSDTGFYLYSEKSSHSISSSETSIITVNKED